MALQGNGSTGWTVAGLGGPPSIGPLTLFCWAKLTATPATNDSVFVSLTNVSSGNTHCAIIATTTNQWWGFDLDNSFAGSIAALTGTNDNLWHAICFVRTSASSHTIYVDTIGNSALDTGTVGTQTLTDFFIGIPFAGSAQPMQTNEAVAHVAYWSGVALTTAQITALLAGTAPSAFSPTAYFPLVSDLTDHTPNNWTLTGATPTFVAGPPVGTGSTVLTSTSGSTQTWTVDPSIAPGTVLTVELWGSGSGGSGGNTSNRAGGAGGAWATGTHTVTISEIASGIPFFINTGSAGTAGANSTAGPDTWFVSNATFLAKGGGATSGTTGGVGGPAASCIPSTGAFSGGHGASRTQGGGGGGAAGKDGAGASPTTGTGGTGDNGIGGAANTSNVEGGGGATAGNPAGTAGAPGAGGGANTSTGSGSAGGRGQIRLTWPMSTAVETDWGVPLESSGQIQANWLAPMEWVSLTAFLEGQTGIWLNKPVFRNRFQPKQHRRFRPLTSTTMSISYDAVIRIEEASVARLDLAIRDEWIEGIRLDLQISIERQGVVREDFVVPTERSGSGIRADWSAPLEWLHHYGGGVTEFTNEFNNEFYQTGDNDIIMPVEWLNLANVSWNSLSPIEWSGVTRSDRVASIEWVGVGLREDLSIPLENLSSLRTDRLLPNERISSAPYNVLVPLEQSSIVYQTPVVPAERLITSRGDAAIPTEHLQVSEWTITVPDEWLGSAVGVSWDSLSPIEFTGNYQRDSSQPTERVTTGLREDLMISIEDLSLLRADRQIPTENLISVDQRDVIPAEWTGGEQQDIRVPAEWLIASRLDAVIPSERLQTARWVSMIPLEWGGSTNNVSWNSFSPIEWTGNTQANLTTPVESVGSTRADASPPAERLSFVRDDQQVRLESTGDVGLIVVDQVEWTSENLLQSLVISQETLALAESDRLVPMEYLGTVSPIQETLNVPMEWTGAVHVFSTVLVPFEVTANIREAVIIAYESIRGHKVKGGVLRAFVRGAVVGPVRRGGQLYQTGDVEDEQ